MRKAAYIGGGILLFTILVVVFFRPAEEDYPQQPISAAIADAKTGIVRSIVVRGDILEVTLVTGIIYESRKEQGVSVYTLLESNDVDTSQILIEVREESKLGDWLGLFLNFLPILIFIALLAILINRTTRQ